MNFKSLTGTVLAGVLSFSAIGLTAAQQKQEQVAHTHLKVGDVAPDFTLPDNKGNAVHLADFRGKKNVVLAFYVLAFTGG
jgi:cytochrome oxidase Cu insertion factor (SCO1/SenC/PrrC family)